MFSTGFSQGQHMHYIGAQLQELSTGYPELNTGAPKWCIGSSVGWCCLVLCTRNNECVCLRWTTLVAPLVAPGETPQENHKQSALLTTCEIFTQIKLK